MDDRQLTLIVVPHGDLETRTFAISYRKLRLIFGVLVAMLLVVCVFLAFLFPALAQATRVQGLLREVAQLEAERAKVAELAQTLAEVEAQYEKVRQMLGADAPVAGEGPTLPPLRQDQSGKDSPTGGDGIQQSAELTVWPLRARGFITRALSGRSGHPGLDIATPANTEIRVAGSGLVKAAGDDPVYGRYVVVDHGLGLETIYGHAARLYVEAGDRVAAGEIIALSGSTGRSTAPHLHFEVRRNGVAVDPLEHVKQP